MEKKIPVAVLGATGSVGQKFITLLETHPWFEIVALAASERSTGKTYGEAANWFQSTPLSTTIADMEVRECSPDLPCRIVFSGLDSSVAGDIETDFAQAGYVVLSNAKNHRMDADVPLLIPEINPGHLALVKQQQFGDGMIVTNPNCSTIGMTMTLKPLIDHFGVEAVHVVTMQALSGAGYPGVASLDIIDNVLPFIGGEEDKLETEPKKIFGTFHEDSIQEHELTISAQCNRVAVIDGHTECLSVKLQQAAEPKDLIAAWREFTGVPQKLGLPTAPEQPIFYFTEPGYPQPKLHRNLGGGMSVSIGRLQRCPVLDYKFVGLSHNTIRGAAGGAILNAELLVQQGYLD